MAFFKGKRPNSVNELEKGVFDYGFLKVKGSNRRWTTHTGFYTLMDGSEGDRLIERNGKFEIMPKTVFDEKYNKKKPSASKPKVYSREELINLPIENLRAMAENLKIKNSMDMDADPLIELILQEQKGSK